MSFYRRKFELFEPSQALLLTEKTSIFRPQTSIFPSFAEANDLDALILNLLNPNPNPNPSHIDLSLSARSFHSSPSPFDIFNSVTDLIQIEKTPFSSSYQRVFQEQTGNDVALQSLCDRVSALELGFDRFAKNGSNISGRDRKYSFTTDIKSSDKNGVDRKYKWSAEFKGGKKFEDGEKNYKWIAELKGKGNNAPISHTYTFKASTIPAGDNSASKKVKAKTKAKVKESPATETRVVKIEEPVDQGATFLRQAFARRAGAVRNDKGKKKELTAQDAALIIQMTFRAYLIRRSQALRALRELAVAKARLKEIRSLFNNFSYRRRIERDAEEKQRFSEKIIVLLLTVDAIEGADVMVRSARRSMVEELEAMLDVVDPQPQGKLGSMKRRRFDLPEGEIQKDIAAGVRGIVEMMDEEKNGSSSSSFEVCL